MSQDLLQRIDTDLLIPKKQLIRLFRKINGLRASPETLSAFLDEFLVTPPGAATSALGKQFVESLPKSKEQADILRGPGVSFGVTNGVALTIRSYQGLLYDVHLCVSRNPELAAQMIRFLLHIDAERQVTLADASETTVRGASCLVA